MAVHARRLQDAADLTGEWTLTLDNGHSLQVGFLDDAPAAVRSYLDARQPEDHGTVDIILTVEPETQPAAEPEVVIEPKVEPPAEPEVEPPADATPYPEPGGMELMLLLLSARETSPDFASAATTVLPWISDLAGHHRPQCLAELHLALTTASNEYRYGDLEQAVARWKPGTGVEDFGDVSAPVTPDPAPTTAPGAPVTHTDTATPADPTEPATPTDSADFLSDYPTATYRSPRQHHELQYGSDAPGAGLPGQDRRGPRHGAGRHRL